MTESSEFSAEQIRAWMRRGRHATLDWMDADASQDSIKASLAAMANTDGGVLVLGISGDKPPVIHGVSDESGAVDRALQAALTLEPALITPLPQLVSVNGHRVIVLEVPAGMPHIYTYYGRYLARDGKANVNMRPVQLRRLMIERGDLSFEMEPAHSATMEDLDWHAVREYMKTLRMPENEAQTLLHKRGCLTRQGSRLVPTNAGILLFGQDPQPWMRGAEITAVRFAGRTMSDTFSRQDIAGTLPDQIRRAETFLIDHLRRGVKLRHTMTREEQFEYPMEAAREVVVNAVAHRDYSINGDGIRLFLFQDRMEVNSPGRLPGPVTVDNIKDERFSRNPVIVQVLSDMGFIERLGYGIDRMIDLMQQNELRAPEFSETAGGFRVKLYNDSAMMSESATRRPYFVDSALLDAYADTPLNARQEAAISYLNQEGNTRITNSELQRMFPDVHAETIRRDLYDLVNKDIFSKRGQKRGAYYVLKRDADAEDAEADAHPDDEHEAEASEVSPDGEGQPAARQASSEGDEESR